MKHLNLFCIAILAVLFLGLFSGCDNKCSGIVCVTAPPSVILDIRDNQNRDLLNPATPGHYDTAKIKQLNNSMFKVIPAGRYPINKDRIKLVATWGIGEITTYLKLSDTDQDTIYTNINKTGMSGCCAGFGLVAFSYNAKPYTDSLASRYFIVVK
ncbi:MAG: hypothetical protein V4592_24110 [Bacteroidota bacterium]